MIRGVEVAIDNLTASEAAEKIPGLVSLLDDAVAGGASIGFMPPLADGEAETYWRSVFDALRCGSRLLLAAFDNDQIAARFSSDWRRVATARIAPRS